MFRRVTFVITGLFFVAAVSLPITGFSQQAGDQAQSQDQGPPTILRTLRRGSSGEDVRRLQNYLSRLPDIYPEGLATGYFGSMTEAAVRRFQEQNGVPAVGIVGPLTRDRLSRGATPPGRSIAEEVGVVSQRSRRGASSDAVRRAQEFLRMFPDIYPEGQATGFFGPATENAVRRFQQVGGLTETGEIDARTQELMNSLMVEGARQKPPKITDVSPTSGTAGVTVTVKGRGFTPANNAIFVRGKTIVSGLDSEDGGTSITFVLPSTAPCTANPPKACPIKIINANGISNARPFKLVGLPEPPAPEPEPTPIPTPVPSPEPERVPVAPSITRLIPSQGPVGAKVTIEGAGFTATGNAVNFAGVANAVTGLASSKNGAALEFNVPQTSCQVGSTCSVSVTNANGASNVVSFLLTQVITPIKVSVPNGGEQFSQGLPNTVSWSGGTDRVQILLVSSDTVTGADPTNKILGWIATSTTPDGSLTWDARKVCNVENTLCSEVTPGQYKILALSEDELGALTLWDDLLDKAGNWDVSDNPFSVVERARLVVTVPNWGGVYSVGQYLVVCWYSYDLASKQVTIVLLKGDQVYKVIKTVSQGVTTGLIEGGFYLPTDLPAGSDYKIQVYDPTNPSIHDESDAPFTVVNASSYVELKTPNGGETWTDGFKGRIQWQAANITSQKVNINLLKGGVFYRTLASNVPQAYYWWPSVTYSSGTFDLYVDIPTDIPTGSDYTLEITDAANPQVRDTSNQPFTIVKLPDTLTIRAKFLDHFTKQTLANQSVWTWDGTTYRQVLTSSTGELLLSVPTASITPSKSVRFWTYPNCYESKSFYVMANNYGLYGYMSRFPLLGGGVQTPVLNEANFGDAAFWQVLDIKWISDIPLKPSLYYRNSATGESWQSLQGYYSATLGTYGRALPVGVDAWAKLEDLSGQINYSPFVNVPAGPCVAKSLSNFNQNIKWEPYQVTATALYSPTYLTIGKAITGSVSASGGTGPYAFTVASGILPLGVNLSSAGVLSGTTTQTGIYNAIIRAEDAQGVNGAFNLSMTVRNADGTIPPFIQMSSPYVGGQYSPGAPLYIGWYSYNIASKSVKIELLKDGAPYRTITTYTQTYPSNYYSYNWTIPADIPAGANYSTRVSDSSNASVAGESVPFWIVTGSGATWSAWSPNYIQQNLFAKYPSANLTNVTSFKVYQRKPGEATATLIASCPRQIYYTSYCTTLTAAFGLWYHYYDGWSQTLRFTDSFVSGTGLLSNLPAGAYEYTITSVDSAGIESAPIATLKMHVMERITVTSPNVTQSPIASPFRIEWSIPANWPAAAERRFIASVSPKTTTSSYYSYSFWYKYAGPFSGLETSGYRLYDGPALDPTVTYQASVLAAPGILDPATGNWTGYLGLSNPSSFWVKP